MAPVIMTPEQIQAWIQAGLPECEAHVEGDGRHFNAVVISPAFAGKGLLQQQRLVYATLGDHLAKGDIHALSVKTYTPDDWNKAE